VAGEAGGGEDRAGRLDGVRPGGRAPGAPPAGGLGVAGEHRRHVPGLVRDDRLGGGELLVRGPALDAHLRRAGTTGDRVEDRAHLVEGEVAPAPTDVAAQRGEQRRQQRGAQQRLLVGERVGNPYGGPARVV